MREAEDLHPTPTPALTPTHAIAKPIGSAPGTPQKATCPLARAVVPKSLPRGASLAVGFAGLSAPPLVRSGGADAWGNVSRGAFAKNVQRRAPQ